VISVDFAPDMGSQSSERRCVWALLFCQTITVMAAPRHASLADVRSPSRDTSAAPYQRQGFVEGPFVWLLLTMVRTLTLVSLVDVPDAISLRALVGTPFNVLDSAASSKHARVLRTSGTDIGKPTLNRLFM
jgi:hypothetical protein